MFQSQLRTYDDVESDAFRAPLKRGGEPVVMKLLRNGFQRKIGLCKPSPIKKMVSAEGIESALKQQTKHLTEHSWQS
jgi:hypothetical protein